jgi:hypothetical protein
MAFRMRHVPMRLASGVFFLNSGLNKQGVDDEMAKGLRQMAATAYPQLGKMEPAQFAKLLSAGELAMGAALLVPMVPAVLAGAALTAFSAGLLGLYLKVPGMRQEGSLRPTQQGTALAKDVWLLGIGLSLLADGRSKR